MEQEVQGPRDRAMIPSQCRQRSDGNGRKADEWQRVASKSKYCWRLGGESAKSVRSETGTHQTVKTGIMKDV